MEMVLVGVILGLQFLAVVYLIILSQVIYVVN